MLWWEREGRLIPAVRTATNRRVYKVEQIAKHQGLQLTGGKKQHGKSPTVEYRAIVPCHSVNVSQ